MTTSLPGRRISVIGTSGAGKTYVATTLAARLGIPYICNDAIIWQPDWMETPREDRQRLMREAAAQESWTFDGNLTASEDEAILERCDTIVWLDLPRWQVHSQVLWRTLKGLITRKPHWENGNAERWRMFFSKESIVWWSIRTFAERRRQYKAIFADPAQAHRLLIPLRSRGEVHRWLDGIPGSTVLSSSDSLSA
jgi:adenylate kinase family enzyme